MKKHFQIYFVTVLFILASCNGQNRSASQTENISPTKMVLLDSIHTIQKVDTIWTSNAPSRITRKIRKDKDGNLLFAAYENIIQYDGLSFTNLAKEEGLDSYDAFDVWEDKKGSIWIASTHFGVFQYPASAEQKIGKKAIKNLTIESGLTHNRSMCIYEDQAGGIWIGSEGGISYTDEKIGSKGQIHFRNFTANDGLTNNSINTIMEDKTGKIWIGTRGTLCVYNPLENREPNDIKFTEFTNNEGETFENIWSIIEDKKGNIWLGGQHGLWRYDGYSFTRFNTNNIMSVFEDKKGNLWFTHSITGHQKAGLSCYEQKYLLDSNPKAIPVFSANNMFFGIAEDKYGAIWVGKLNGVFRYDGKSVSYFKNEQSKEGNRSSIQF